MLLIYVPKLTNRAGYTINVVMRNILQTDFAITTDVHAFKSYGGPRLCYALRPVEGCDAPFQKAARILFETSIEEQECHCFDFEGMKVLFPVYGYDTVLPFDPFAASFFMLSRYEEYLPHRKDEHGRFLASESIAYREGFLQSAVVDRWAFMLRDVLVARYPELQFRARTFMFEQTVDIDAAYCYLHKGAFRTVTGLMRDGIHRHDMDEIWHRLRVLRGKEEDPYDTFDYILDMSRKYVPHSNLIFFALMAFRKFRKDR